MKILPQALVVGMIAALAVIISSIFNLAAWALFLAWVGYFVLGPTVRTACFSWIHILIGIIIGTGLIICNSVLVPYLGQWALALLVFVIATSLTFMEPAKPLNNIPAYYFGMIMLFASGSSPNLSAIISLMIPITIGLCLGWLTVTVREKVSGGTAASIPQQEVSNTVLLD